MSKKDPVKLAMNRVLRKLASLPKKEFMRLMREHRNGDIARMYLDVAEQKRKQGLHA